VLECFIQLSVGFGSICLLLFHILQQDIAEGFNKYFANVVEKIRKRQIDNNCIIVSHSKNIVNYTEFMGQDFTDKYQSINCKCSTKGEIEKISPCGQWPLLFSQLCQT
jgi:hypothetical protein